MLDPDRNVGDLRGRAFAWACEFASHNVWVDIQSSRMASRTSCSTHRRPPAHLVPLVVQRRGVLDHHSLVGPSLVGPPAALGVATCRGWGRGCTRRRGWRDEVADRALHATGAHRVHQRYAAPPAHDVAVHRHLRRGQGGIASQPVGRLRLRIRFGTNPAEGEGAQNSMWHGELRSCPCLMPSQSGSPKQAHPCHGPCT